MVRSMYSGVSGLRTHQTRMDAIGNNIANVNTYGYKSSRATFRDIYYQNLRSASSPSAVNGGVNPNQVGYGTQVGSIDLMMSQSTFSLTGQGMDLAIDGEGFFQVMDGAGNIYYTRAGMLNFDAAGNLVDMQGNFVLGTNGDPSGKEPGSEKITVSLPAVNPAAGSITKTINGKEFTITASNNTLDSNVNMNFTSSTNMADGVKAIATVTSTGIVVTFNANETFTSWADVTDAVNAAVIEGNGGEEHAAGLFTIEYSGDTSSDPFDAANLPAVGYLTGEQLTSTSYGIDYGTASMSVTNLAGGVYPTGSVGSEFSGDGDIESLAFVYTAGPPASYAVTATINGVAYTADIDETRTEAGTVYLKNAGSDTDYIEFKRPSFDKLDAALGSASATYTGTGANPDFTGTASPSGPSYALGLSSTSMLLSGGTVGGPQTLADMTGIAISTDGVIIGYDSVGAEIIIGRIDLATFANPAGLTQSGSTTYLASRNSGTPVLARPGTMGAGQLVSSTLELSNVDLSNEFSDMITTQRGYQANSRIITVSDTMLEELINLKR